MRREDLLDILSKMSPRDLTLTVLMFRGGGMITIDTVLRQEEMYMVVRGREGGSTDEARGFFVSYDDVSYVKLDRVIKGNEILRMYGENVPEDVDRLADPNTQVGSMSAADNAAAAAKAAPSAGGPAPAPAMDPAAIAKANLLERIRAARTSAGTSNLPAKK